GPRRLDGRVHLGAAIGGIAFFVFIFVFYTYRDQSDYLWPIALALVVLPALRAPAIAVVRTWRPAVAAALAIVGAIAVAAIPPAAAHPAANAGPDTTVLQYNVHEGLDYWSVPSAPALVDRIESANADLVSLEEVNRGWDLSAGIDFFSYLRWRLPQYHAVYGRMDTALFGNAILSRYPITDSGHGILPHINSVLMRGYVWANVAAPGGPVLFVATHFTAYEGFDTEREAQADAYAAFWAKRPRAILAGDYNAHPDDLTITRLVGSGLVDAGAAAGIATAFTYSSGDPHERIDYVFVSPDVTPVSARILDGTASDHRPVLVVVRLK
ncbi:MAG TPA: endonuclease/exonuclease/phosphatase family protein, partial [Candidatus Limnocylindria bacterium]|nr:endonuclease/exonuclease/phosphatase family protein [Candidatus Limnocylindria bacterium]